MQFSSDISDNYLLHFKSNSRIAAEALKKFLIFDKNGLSGKEKNILYKLKSSSIPEIDEKLQYLEAKKKIIKLLRELRF